MKRIPLFVCLVLLLVVTVIPAATASPIISSISPVTAPNTGDVIITITGSGFNDNTTVWLDTWYVIQDPIYGTIVSRSPTSITCRFSLNGKAATQYNLWVNSPFTDPFGNYNPQDVATLTGGFKVYQGDVTAATTTTSPVPGSGSISVSSNPSGANIYIDNEYKGLTSLTLQKVENGNHVVKVRLAGYQDWTRNVAVYGNSQSLFATLAPIPAATSSPTTSPPVTAYPTPTATVPTPKSPAGTEVGIIGIIGAALIFTKRK